MFSCSTCQLLFKSKKCLAAHFKTKKHLTGKKETIHKCACGKCFSYRQGLYTHKKTCTYTESTIETENEQYSEVIQVLKEENNEMRERLDKKDQEMEVLRKQVESLMARSTGNTTNRNSNNNTHIENQHVNIVVNSFGNENIEHLTDKLVCKLIQAGPFTCLPKIIERIHFDPEHPENHNIKVTNLKNRYAKIVKDNKWITTNKKQVIDTMIQNGYGLLEEKYQDNKESISEFKQERFEDFQEKYADQDKDLMKTIKENVDIAIINGSNQLHK